MQSAQIRHYEENETQPKKPYYQRPGWWVMISGALLGVIVIICGIVFVAGIPGVYDEAIQYRNLHEANEGANKVVYNKFLTVLTTKGKITTASVEAQQDLFATVMNSKQKSAGALLNFLHEHNPNPDQALTKTSELFKDMMASVEGLREEFARVQKKSLDIEREHKNLIQGFWTSMQLSWTSADMTPLETQIVTAPETEEAFSGQGGEKPIDLGFGT